jgi:hypothetical protein
MEPTIGRIVLFTLDEQNEKRITEENGNNATCSPVLPAVIVKVWSASCVNLKVLTDGPKDLWVTSVSFGTGPRTCAWPQRS